MMYEYPADYVRQKHHEIADLSRRVADLEATLRIVQAIAIRMEAAKGKWCDVCRWQSGHAFGCIVGAALAADIKATP